MRDITCNQNILLALFKKTIIGFLMSQQTFHERRQSPRVEVDLWIEEQQGSTTSFRWTGNISSGGLFFENTIPHPLGTTVKLKFQLPGSKEIISVTGKTVQIPHGSKLGMGIEFLDLSEATKNLIQSFLQNLSGKNNS